MRNERNLYFEALTVEQTDRLLGSLDHLPVSGSAAHRIRERVLQSAAPKTHSRNRIRKTMLPIAACLLAIVLFFVANPKAAYAVSAFFGRVFTPSRYMNADPAERTPVPSIDEAIAAAAPKDGDYTITLMPDLPNAQEFIGYRTQNGYAPFSEENWGWLKDIRPEIVEVLYDGNQLIWNTNLYMDNVHVREFMEGFGMKSGSKLSVDASMGDVTYTVAGDPTVYSLQVSGHGITPVSDETALASADHVVLYSDFYIDPAQPLPDGVLTITQTIEVCENDAMDYGAMVAKIQHTFTFDATKGNTTSAEGNSVLIPLSGVAYLSVDHKERDAEGTLTSWTVETKKVSLDGVKLNAEFEYLPTGIMVHLKLNEVPPDWTGEMKKAFMRMTPRNNYNVYVMSGFASDLYIDGEFIGETPQPDGGSRGELTYIIPVFPDQYAGTKSIVVKIALVYYETYNGTNQVGGEVYKIPDGISPTDTVTNVTPLAEIPVPLP